MLSHKLNAYKDLKHDNLIKRCYRKHTLRDDNITYREAEALTESQ